MAEVASAFVSIIPSAKGFGSKLNSQVGGDIDSSGKKLGSRLGTAMKGGALAAVGGAVLAGAFLKDAVGMAGELEQSVGAIDTVFGKSASKMHKWAKGAAQDVGLTQNEFNELGTLIGSQLKNGGTAMDQLAPKTNNLITMGADLSSMFGGSTKEAVEALSSALKGERDPIERYGVSLNQAKIDAEAAALGFEKVGGALTDEAKQAATLSLITKQTSDAHGNFAKESGTLAGQQQRLSASFDNMKTSLGTALLPVVTRVVTAFNDWLPKISEFGRSLSDAAGPALKVFGDYIKSTVIPTIQRLADWVTGSLVPALQDFGRDVLPAVKDALGSVRDGLKSAQPFFELVGNIVTKVLIPVIGKLARTILPLMADQLQIVAEGFGKLGDAGTWLWNKALQPAFKFIVKGIASILDMWASMLSTLAKVPGFGWAKKAADAMGDAADKARDIADGIKKIPTSKTVNITVAYKYTGLKSPTRGRDDEFGLNPRGRTSNGPQRVFNQVLKGYGEVGENLMDRIAKGIKVAKPKAVNAAQDAFDALRSKMESKRDELKSTVDSLTDTFNGIRDSVVSAFTGSLFDVEATEGKTAGQAFIDNLMGKRAELTGLLASFNVLKGWGVAPGFLTQLFASGNGGLITDLANMGQAGALSTASLFGDVTNLSGQLGTAVASNDAVTAELATANQTLIRMETALSYLGDDIGRALDQAASKAQRDKKGRDKK